MSFNYRAIEHDANYMQDHYNKLNGTDLRWSVKSVRENKVTLVWSYLDVELEISSGVTEGGDAYVKSYDPQQEKTIRYYLIGTEFYHDYKNPVLALERLVKNSVQVLNNIY